MCVNGMAVITVVKLSEFIKVELVKGCLKVSTIHQDSRNASLKLCSLDVLRTEASK